MSFSIISSTPHRFVKMIFNKIFKYRLEIAVFVSGVVVMVLEIVGSRVLSPYLGNSIFVWSSLIGVILGSLSIGYWLGGRISDKKASIERLSDIFFLSSISVFLLIIVKDLLLSKVSGAMNLGTASLLSGILLFSPSSVLLGMVSPYIIKLRLTNLKKSGRTVGFLSALSALGNIIGTFLAGFILLSYLGTNKILFLLSAVLLLLSVFLSPKRRIGFKLGMILVVVVFENFYSFRQGLLVDSGYIDVDTGYNRVIIYESTDYNTQRPIRSMIQDKQSSSAMFLDGDDLVYEYTKYYDLADHFKSDIKYALMIGGAAYSYPKEFLRSHQDSSIDVVEIDPGITQLARDYFNLKDDPRLRIIHEDGRVYLNSNSKKYDAIYGDAFFSLYAIPPHLTTLEFMQKVFNSLNEDGVYVVNVISAVLGDKSEFLRSEYKTMKAVFPQVFVYRVNDREYDSVQNIILVASKSNVEFSKESYNYRISTYLNREVSYSEDHGGFVLTDDFAPVERFAWNMISR